MRIIRATVSALAILALTASVAAATVVVPEGGIDRVCDGANQTISGTVTVTTASSGALTLTLYGKNRGQETALDTFVINVVSGDTSYDYEFTGVPIDSYQSFIIKTDGATPEKSESIDVEVECDTPPIPEAPVTGLLVATAGLGAAWFVFRRMRATNGQIA